jgi:hypothetical protein
MSLKETKSTKHWASIPRKCKLCMRAIYTKEDSEIYYQCSIYGSFKKDCTVETEQRNLPKPEDIK